MGERNYTLRPYQQEAVDAVMEWVRKSSKPCVVDAATGSGKSLMIADIAYQLHKISKGKRVLCLAPSTELIEQNFEKFSQTGLPASIYSASIAKDLRHNVVYASPLSFRSQAKRLGDLFTAIIIDEAQSTTKTILNIISDMRESNPYLRVIGLTATPYRLKEGYIYKTTVDNQVWSDYHAKDPFYEKCVYEIKAQKLIRDGYLTPPVVGAINAEVYDTSLLVLNSGGSYTTASIDKAFVGHGRKTSAIVGDVVEQSKGRRGVMFFASTIAHAEEIMASLPPELSVMVTGKLDKKLRKKYINDFKKMKVKYIVNVDVLTTGFDAPHVDVIAVLRATESATLYQQIIGRGTRLFDGKDDFLLLDYAGNIERLFPDGDVFNPEIKASFSGETSEKITVKCPECNGDNVVSLRLNDFGYLVDENGYFTDIDGNRIKNGDQEFPAHFSRRCSNIIGFEKNELVQCDYFWSHKECEACGADNDITARRCKACGHELIDPNEKLTGEFRAMKRDPMLTQTDDVVRMSHTHGVSRSGNEMYTVIFDTTHRKNLRFFFMLNTGNKFLEEKTQQLLEATADLTLEPETISYRRNPKKENMWDLLNFNMPSDDSILAQKLEELKK